MSSRPAARPFEVRHLQLSRAVLAALAAAMITFSADHSASFGLAVFSGFVITVGIVLLIGAWLVTGTSLRTTYAAIGILSIISGMVTGIPPWRTIPMFFFMVIGWALVTGLIEGIMGWRAMRQAAVDGDPDARSDARDSLVVGAITVLFGLGLLFVPAQYALTYTISGAPHPFTLTGIAIAVGVFGGYVAIIAVYLGIAGFSPRRPAPAVASATDPEETA